VDTLLCCSVIEARSCERFGVLARASRDAELAQFYRALCAAEARHHQLYVGLAETLAPRPEVAGRLAELLRLEAELVAQGTPGVRLHG
jgi:tRNA-(ms[2]io[6]A)-hydroxylase